MVISNVVTNSCISIFHVIFYVLRLRELRNLLISVIECSKIIRMFKSDNDRDQVVFKNREYFQKHVKPVYATWNRGIRSLKGIPN